ncbi:NUDIX domain-containing protein [Candidatus Woesearchaeota archaeon]|nr:NUDIX domain-containing protein [Candidatus Woesearchaeota archaeon]
MRQLPLDRVSYGLKKFPALINHFSKTLPHFPDGRIDYSGAAKAPVVIVFVKCGKNILLLKRSGKVRAYRRKWQAVAGYLDEIKPLKQKALEELREEAGISPEQIKSWKFGTPYTFNDKRYKKEWIVYPVLVELKKKPAIKIDWEHTEYRWINPKDITKFDRVKNVDVGMEIVGLL